MSIINDDYMIKMVLIWMAIMLIDSDMMEYIKIHEKFIIKMDMISMVWMISD